MTSSRQGGIRFSPNRQSPRKRTRPSLKRNRKRRRRKPLEKRSTASEGDFSASTIYAGAVCRSLSGSPSSGTWNQDVSPIISVRQTLSSRPIGSELETADVSEQDGEYEEISSEEVDRVVAALELLSESATSETIKSILDGCSSEIYYLVYEDEDGMSEAA